MQTMSGPGWLYKRCSRCHTWKVGIDNFAWNPARHDLLDNYCKDCRKVLRVLYKAKGWSADTPLFVAQPTFPVARAYSQAYAFYPTRKFSPYRYWPTPPAKDLWAGTLLELAPAVTPKATDWSVWRLPYPIARDPHGRTQERVLIHSLTYLPQYRGYWYARALQNERDLPLYLAYRAPIPAKRYVMRYCYSSTPADLLYEVNGRQYGCYLADGPTGHWGNPADGEAIF